MEFPIRLLIKALRVEQQYLLYAEGRVATAETAWQRAGARTSARAARKRADAICEAIEMLRKGGR